MYHGSMKHAAPVRRELKIKTVMNLLGPLVNPVGSAYQLIGVFSDEYCLKMARAANLLGIKQVMVVHSEDGLDEISVCAPTRVVEINARGEEREYTLDPSQFGVGGFHMDELKGGTPSENAKIGREILSGKGNEALKEAVCVNAGASLYICGIAGDVETGYTMAKEALESGKVKQKVDQITKLGKKLAS